MHAGDTCVIFMQRPGHEQAGAERIEIVRTRGTNVSGKELTAFAELGPDPSTNTEPDSKPEPGPDPSPQSFDDILKNKGLSGRV